MRILASDQVAGWLRNSPPGPRRRVRAALRGLERWQGDNETLRGELEGFIGCASVVIASSVAWSANRLFNWNTLIRDVVYEAFRQLRLLSEIDE